MGIKDLPRSREHMGPGEEAVTIDQVSFGQILFDVNWEQSHAYLLQPGTGTGCYHLRISFGWGVK